MYKFCIAYSVTLCQWIALLLRDEANPLIVNYCFWIPLYLWILFFHLESSIHYAPYLYSFPIVTHFDEMFRQWLSFFQVFYRTRFHLNRKLCKIDSYIYLLVRSLLNLAIVQTGLLVFVVIFMKYILWFTSRFRFVRFNFIRISAINNNYGFRT